MGMKFLNKKGWHTGSLRNIENVWKAEQKHEAEQKKLEELRKQIHEERERADFRQLQVDAGLIPRQERLDFLYESGLAVGKGSSSFQELDSLPKTAPETGASSSAQAPSAEKQQQPAAPGALFEDSKPQSANDAWRKLHSDPLLLIRQREQEALARIKNNPIQMAMIRKSAESKKEKKAKKHSTKKHKKKHLQHSSSENDSDSEETALTEEKQKESRQRDSNPDKHSHKEFNSRYEEPSEGYAQRKKYNDKEYRDQRRSSHQNPKYEESNNHRLSRKSRNDSKNREYYSERDPESHYDRRSHISSDKPPRNESNNWHRNPVKRSEEESDLRNPKYEESDDGRFSRKIHYDSKNREYSSDKKSHISSSDKPPRNELNNRHRNPVKLSEEERAARLREMQMDAEKHEEQRWKRIKKADDTDAQEAVRDKASLGRNFLDAAQKSVYGAEKGGSTTIEESVRRRTHYLQGKSATESNAFRR